MLASAREEVRTYSKAELAASGTIKELRALVAELECKLLTKFEAKTEDEAKPEGEAKAALKIQAAARGWCGRTDYRLVRDSEACRQWVAFHVDLGQYKEAEQLGWDGQQPPAPTKRALKANAAAYAKDDEPMIPVRDAVAQAAQRPPPYRRTRSINTAARASPNAAARAVSTCSPVTIMPVVKAKGCKSPQYSAGPPDWLRAAASPAKEPELQAFVLSSGHPHHDMIELVRDVEACRQWVAFHVARGEYKDAVELGWDGANPPPPTEQELGLLHLEVDLLEELLKVNQAEYGKDEEGVKVAPSSPRDVCIEVFARPPVKPHQNMIEIAAHASPALVRPGLPLPRAEACIEVVARSPINPHQDMIEVPAHISLPEVSTQPTFPLSTDVSQSRLAAIEQEQDDAERRRMMDEEAAREAESQSRLAAIEQGQDEAERQRMMDQEAAREAEYEWWLAGEEALARELEVEKEVEREEQEAFRSRSLSEQEALRSTSAQVDVRARSTSILERQACFLNSAKNERLDTANNEASARVNERLDSMVKVSPMAVPPDSPPVPPQRAPAGSGQLSTPRVPLGAQPPPRRCKRAASKAADVTAFDDPGSSARGITTSRLPEWQRPRLRQGGMRAAT